MRRPSPVSAIAIREAEFAAGLIAGKPDCWTCVCRQKRCPGIEIIRLEGEYCPMRLGDECWVARRNAGHGIEMDWIDPMRSDWIDP